MPGETDYVRELAVDGGWVRKPAVAGFDAVEMVVRTYAGLLARGCCNERRRRGKTLGKGLCWPPGRLMSDRESREGLVQRDVLNRNSCDFVNDFCESLRSAWSMIEPN